MSIQPRDYQDRAIEALIRYFDHKSGNPLVIAPTGSGKSVIIGALCHRILTTWPEQRLMILSHVKELLEQNFGKIKAFWPEASAGLYCAGLGEKRSRDPITVASIQSVYRKPHIFGWRDLLLIDEAHLLSPESDSMYQAFIAGLKEINPRLKVIGFTATAYRLKTGMLHEGPNRLFTDIAIEITLDELLQAGHIAPLVSKSSVIQADLSTVGDVAGEYNSRDMEAAMDKEALTKAALDEVFTLAADRKSWLLFTAGVNHAAHVEEELIRRGKTAKAVTGNTPEDEREAAHQAFKTGELECLVSVGIHTTGFDAPNIDLIVMLVGTKSPGRYMQIMGRGMRNAPGKENCLVLDYAGNIEYHGPVTHVRPPRQSAQRGKQERNERTCLICPACRMASPLGARECAECGLNFDPPERVKHGTTASTAAVMGMPTDPGDWHDVKAVRYFKHEKEGKTLTLRVEYECGMETFKEWVCLAHPPGFAKSKADEWWRRRGLSPIPAAWEPLAYALDMCELLKKPYRIRVKRDEKFWRVVGYDFTPPPIESEFVVVGEPWDFGDADIPF